MKIFLTLALVALLFNVGITGKVPKRLKTSASEEVISQELAAESDDSENALDTTVVNNVANTATIVETAPNTVNLLDTTSGAAKTVSTLSIGSTKLVSPLKTVVAPMPTVSVVKSPIQTLSVVKTRPQVTKSVVYSPAPQVVKSWSAPQVSYSVPTQQVVYSQNQPQQFISVQQQPQQVVYSQVQQPLEVLSVPQQQQQLVYSSYQQPQMVVMKGGRQVWLDQAPITKTVQYQPGQITKTYKAPNPMVVQWSPSRPTVSKQTVLTGSQLYTDVSDSLESSKLDVLAQEPELY